MAPAVARAAMDSGVAKYPISDWDAYRKSLDRRLSDHIKKIAIAAGFDLSFSMNLTNKFYSFPFGNLP